MVVLPRPEVCGCLDAPIYVIYVCDFYAKANAAFQAFAYFSYIGKNVSLILRLLRQLFEGKKDNEIELI